MNALTKYLVLAVVGFLSVTGADRGHVVEAGRVMASTTTTQTAAGTMVITWLPMVRACQELSRQGHRRACRPIQ